MNGKELVPKEYMTMIVVTALRKLDLKIDMVCVCVCMHLIMMPLDCNVG